MLSYVWIVSSCQRPYYSDYTRSHLNSEVKRCQARIVLGWGTAREVHGVLLAFLFVKKWNFVKLLASHTAYIIKNAYI